MKEGLDQGYLFSEGGIHCPVCGGRMTRRSLFCGHCRRSGRFRVDKRNVREVAREIHLPRAMSRNHLRRSA